MTEVERKDWLRKRQKGIGSSDAASIIGIGYQSAFDVYNAKTDPDPVDRIEPFLQRGIDLEPIVAKKYAEEMGKELRPAGFVTSKENPWQISNPDFTGADDRYTEIKTVLFWTDEWGEPFTSHVPEKYWTQGQHQMGVRGGCDHMDIAAFELTNWKLRIYRINFDPDFFEWLTSIEKRFWAMVEARRPPGPEWEDQFKDEYLRRIVQRDKAVRLGDEWRETLDELQALKDVAKEAAAKAEPLKLAIQQAMGIVEVAHCGPWKITRAVNKNNVLSLRFTKKEEK